MSEIDRVFTGSMPDFYDRYLGPQIFAAYGEDLAERTAALRPARVLETAAGTGIVTRALARILGPEAEITATDLNQAMLDFASAQPGSERVTWRQADAQHLPFDDGLFDVVLCQFGVMFFPDRLAGYREARRVLRPQGKFLFSLWDRLAENEFSQIVANAVAALFPEDPPQFLVRTPYAYHDTELIKRELIAAGFDSVTIETVPRRSLAPSAREPALGLCCGSPMRAEIEARAADKLEAAINAAAAAIAARFGSGAVDGKIQAHIVTASR
jgi:ubiquinone/menaquinone biosynthesis C-methylase UbiE